MFIFIIKLVLLLMLIPLIVISIDTFNRYK